MSIQAGIWQLDGAPADRALLNRLSQDAAQFGPDGETIRVDGPIAMLYRPFHTTREARLERQPYVTARGSVITWDGRLDNRDELATRLGKSPRAEWTDVALVAQALDKWATGCYWMFFKTCRRLGVVRVGARRSNLDVRGRLHGRPARLLSFEQNEADLVQPPGSARAQFG